MRVRSLTLNLILVLLASSIALQAQQRNHPNARFLVNGIEASVYDEVDHVIPVCVPGPLELLVCTGDVNRDVIMLLGNYSPGATQLPFGSVDLSNASIAGIYRSSMVAPVNGANFAAYRLNLNLNPALAGVTTQAIQFLVQDPTNPTSPFRLTETARIRFVGPNANGDCVFPQKLYESEGKHTPPGSAKPCGKSGDSDEFIELDPVYLFSGEYYMQKTDLRIEGRGFDFEWTRKYRSQIPVATAQGNGWDYSYNIWLESVGAHLRVHDGNTRSDIYYYNASTATWTSQGLFHEIRQNPDGSYILEFSDTSEWHFHALDGSAQEGRASSVLDRNKNQLNLSYDAQGRLDLIVDTLGRSISVAYDSNGMIASVTDFTGRVVSYKYFDGSTAGGNAGDLASVTTPAVVGTPNGNDFPGGKTMTYTYSKGFTQAALNGNLLTMTDAKGQTYLTNVYHTTTNPFSFNFDRVIRQTWGNAGDLIDFVYEPQFPTPSNNYAVVKTIVNDRVGNVKEIFYDGGNRGVMLRELTGRANPDAPTTSTSNRPGPALRPGDPTHFETRISYNADNQPLLMLHPNGNSEVMVYDSLNPDPRARGNLLEKRRNPGLLGGDQTVLVDSYEYDVGAGCCGTNFVTRHTDPRGNDTTHSYDANGNRLQSIHRINSIVEDFKYNGFGQIIEHVQPDNGSTGRRRDVTTYYSAGPMMGYRETEVTDADNLALTDRWFYDAVGNVVASVDPNGNRTDFVVNERDQIMRMIEPAVSGVRYETDYRYDLNDNLIQEDIQNVDATGTVSTNAYITNTFDYEVLNHRIRITAEIDSANTAVTEYAYDENRNQILERSGVATSGVDPNNVLQTLYDERDLVFRIIRGAGSTSQSTTQYDYDGNGNPTETLSGIEGAPQIDSLVFDGYDRVIGYSDSLGNDREFVYDANGNTVVARLFGEVFDQAGSGGNILLAEVLTTLDVMDRRLQISRSHFDRASQLPIGDGQVDTTIVWSGISEPLQVTDDNGNSVTYAYDSANRRISRTDPVGNNLLNQLDANSNVLAVLSTELPSAGGGAEVYTSSYAYDALDRAVSTTDNVGVVEAYGWDSRNNLETIIDGRGNETRWLWDGLNRPVGRIIDMNGNGASASDAVDIVATQVWDDASRLLSQIDDNGNATSYVYDSLDRQVATTFGDGTQVLMTWDLFDNIVGTVDANGSSVTHTYDPLNRLVGRSIIPGAGVSAATTIEAVGYDGASRVVYAADDDSIVLRNHDSLSRILSETLNGVTTTMGYDGVGRRLSIGYPGGRQITQSWDSADRRTAVSEGATTIASWDYIGLERIARRVQGNGTQTDYSWNGIANGPGDFGVKKIDRITHSDSSSGVVLDDWSFRWDRMENKTRREDERAGGSGRRYTYGYDPANRMRSSQLSLSGGLAQVPRIYTHDGVHNRVNVGTQILVGGSNNYFMDPAQPPSDFQANQYTQTPFDSRSYDENGNLATTVSNQGNQRSFEYDYRNQMVAWVDQASAERVEFDYDLFGRRIEKRVINGAQVTAEVYYYDGWRVIEERDIDGAVVATYVYGLYIDQVLSMRRNGVDFYYHADDLANVTALTNAAGIVVERYDYGDYGSPRFFDAAGTPIANSRVGNPILFTGRRFDAETGLYYYRTRYLDPRAGRFTTRDTIGIWTDFVNMGNGYAYLANNPWSDWDPVGLGFWDVVQGALDVAGMVPGVGNAADLVNAGISVARGNYDEAALNLAAAVPGAGQAVTGAKLARRGAKAAKKLKKTPKPKKPKKNKPKKEEKKPNSGKRGTCSAAKHARLKAGVKKACKTKGEKQRCTDKNGKCRKDLTCAEIRIRGLTAKACQKARNAMNRTCYGGGDANHRMEADRASKRANECKRCYNSRCHEGQEQDSGMTQATQMQLNR